MIEVVYDMVIPVHQIEGYSSCITLFARVQYWEEGFDTYKSDRYCVEQVGTNLLREALGA